MLAPGLSANRDKRICPRRFSRASPRSRPFSSSTIVFMGHLLGVIVQATPRAMPLPSPVLAVLSHEPGLPITDRCLHALDSRENGRRACKHAPYWMFPQQEPIGGSNRGLHEIPSHGWSGLH